MTCYVAPYRYTDIQIYRCTDIQIYRYIDIQIYRCTEDILGHLTHHFTLSPLGLHTERTENPALLATNNSRWDKDFSWNL